MPPNGQGQDRQPGSATCSDEVPTSDDDDSRLAGTPWRRRTRRTQADLDPVVGSSNGTPMARKHLQMERLDAPLQPYACLRRSETSDSPGADGRESPEVANLSCAAVSDAGLSRAAGTGAGYPRYPVPPREDQPTGAPRTRPQREQHPRCAAARPNRTRTTTPTSASTNSRKSTSSPRASTRAASSVRSSSEAATRSRMPTRPSHAKSTRSMTSKSAGSPFNSWRKWRAESWTSTPPAETRQFPTDK